MSDHSDTYVENAITKLKALSRQANGAIDGLFDLANGNDCDANENELKAWLSDKLTQQYRIICDALEKFHRNAALVDFKEGFARYDNLTRVEYDSLIGSFFSPVQALLSSYADILELNVQNGDASSIHTSIRIFENILHGTAMIMERQGIEPGNETEMNRLMRTIVSAAFPDTTSNPNIPTVVKTYKPEFGVPSLGALAEYKFAKSETELKQCLDGIMADSRGYQADGKWKRFYAVLFLTGAFFTPAQIEEQFKQCGIHDSWKAIVLVGKGGKKKTTKPQPATPAAVTTATAAKPAAPAATPSA